MLIRFAATNVRSFRDAIEISMATTRMTEPGVGRHIEWQHSGSGIDLLPAAGIFGANASGKTNALRAMADMTALVLHSFRSGTASSPVARNRFLLDDVSERPTTFEVDLVIEGIRHTYGFEVNDSRVLEEWAFWYPRGRRALLFERGGSNVQFGGGSKTQGREILRLLRPNALFLSTAAAAGYVPLEGLFRWFSENFLLAEAANRSLRQAHTVEMMQREGGRERVLNLLRVADLGIENARLRLDPEVLERLQRAVRVLNDLDDEGEPFGGEFSVDDASAVRLGHKGASGTVELDSEDESLGTVVWLGLIGPILEALAQGSVLLADELDSSLHPHLVRETIRLFQDPATNPHGAQMVFNAFDLTVLGDGAAERLLGRDQTWFTEKQSDGSTNLYPLTDFSPRKDEALADRYLRGRYGAVPIIDHGEFESALELVEP